MKALFETESHHGASAKEIALEPRGRYIELVLRTPGGEGGRGEPRNAMLTTLQAKTLAYALLLEAEKAIAAD